MDLRDSGDELVPTKCPHSSHRQTSRTRHQPGFSRPPSMAARRAEGRCGMQRDLTSPQMPHGKTHCVSMQPPPQSGVLLFAKHNHLAPHSFTGYQPLISGCRVNGTTSHSHDNSLSLAAAVCMEQPFIHMIIAPHQWLPCERDNLSFT